MTAWRNRIVSHGEEAPGQLLAHPFNWRIHPKAQQDALAGALAEVGWVQDIIVNQRTGHVIDGHLRVALAISREEPTVPVVYVDLDEREEAIVLATIDPLSAMAGRDDGLLADLVRGLEVGDGALAEMLAGMMDNVGEAGFPELPEGERGAFRTMTFTVTERQEILVKEALKAAKGPAPDDNEDSNGAALEAICSAYLN